MECGFFVTICSQEVTLPNVLHTRLTLYKGDNNCASESKVRTLICRALRILRMSVHQSCPRDLAELGETDFTGLNSVKCSFNQLPLDLFRHSRIFEKLHSLIHDGVGNGLNILPRSRVLFHAHPPPAFFTEAAHW